MVRPRAKAVATLGATKKGAGSGIWVSHAAGVAVAVGEGCSRAGRREASGRKQCCPPQPRLLTLDLAFHPAEAGGGGSSGQPPVGGGERGWADGEQLQRLPPGRTASAELASHWFLSTQRKRFPAGRQFGLLLFKSFHTAKSPLQLFYPTLLPARENHPWVQVPHPTPLLGLTSVSPHWTPFHPGLGEPGKRTLQQAIT